MQNAKCKMKKLLLIVPVLFQWMAVSAQASELKGGSGLPTSLEYHSRQFFIKSTNGSSVPQSESPDTFVPKIILQLSAN